MPAQSSPGPSDRAVSYEYGLPGENLDSVVGRFAAAAKDDPFSTWLILPTERLVRHAGDMLAGQKCPFITSRICTLDGFCKIIFEENRTTERYLAKREAKLQLADILEKNARDVPLFVTRDHPSPGTVDDLMTFMNVTLMRKVAFPECLLGLQSAKTDQLDTIIAEYRNRLSELDLVDDDTILPWTIDQLNRCETSPLGSVFIYGFHEPLPLEEDLFGAIRDRAGSVFTLIPDGIDPGVFRHRAAPGDLPAIDPAPVPSQITGLFSGSGALDAGDRFRVQTFPTRYAEVYGIAAEIGRLSAAGTPLSGIAVVFPDLRGDFGLVEEVFADAGIAWNAAVGPKLSRAPVVQFLLQIPSLVTGGYAREDVVRLVASPFFRRDVVPGGASRLSAADLDLVSRYAGIDSPRPDWAGRLDRLHEQLKDPDRAKNYPGITVNTVERVRDGLSILLRDLDALAGKKPIRDHIAGFRLFLEQWNIPCLDPAPDQPTREREAALFRKFCTRLEAFAGSAWIPAGEPVSFAEFARLIASIGEEEDRGRQESGGVNVLGLRECPHMKFPVVFIGGLTEGTFPRLTTRLPFTNSLENAKMGTRSLSEILREEQYYFIAALLSAGKSLYLSAPLADGDKVLLTSAFFERVRARAGDCPWPAAGEEAVPASQRTAAVRAGTSIRDADICPAVGNIPASLCIDDLVDRVNMERFHRHGVCDSPYDGILSGDEKIREALASRYGPDHVWSPTSLETYATCPFAYFLNRVVNLQALPEVEPNLSAGDRGTAIHDVLSTFYREWRAAGRTTVSPASLADATELILRLAREELDTYSFQSPLWDATRILMLGDLHTGPGYFERFLACETEEADSALVPTRFEYSFGMGKSGSDAPSSSPEPVALASPDGGQTAFFRGRIDRIDIAPDGSFLIYDYKSGSQHPTAKDLVAGTALQLPLYLLAFGTITGSHGIGGGYYTIRREIDRSIVLADAAAKELMVSKVRPSADFAGLLAHSRECTFSYISGIRSGAFPLPREEKCPNPYCEFSRICRFDPYRVFQAGEET